MTHADANAKMGSKVLYNSSNAFGLTRRISSNTTEPKLFITAMSMRSQEDQKCSSSALFGFCEVGLKVTAAELTVKQTPVEVSEGLE